MALRFVPRIAFTFVSGLLLILLPPGVGAQSAVDSDLLALGQEINQILDGRDFREAHWGVLAVDLITGDTLFTRNAHKNFTPASNVKLFTSAAALSQLGPDFTYFTEVWAHGQVHEGVLRGDLVVRGSGDPTIGDRELNNEGSTAIFQAWADSLLAHGITEITGSVVGDDRVIDNTPLGLGWAWSDPPRRYAAEIGGLVFNLNVVDFTLRGLAPGRPAQISWEPYNTSFVDVRNATLSLPRGAGMNVEYDRDRATNVFTLSSRIPTGRTYRQQLSITNPSRYFTHVLKEVLQQNGIRVHGGAISSSEASTEPTYTGPTWLRVATYTSPPLAEISKRINKDSQNLYAEQVLRTLGALRPRGNREEPGTAEMGVRASFRTLLEAGADTSALRLADGSGLSRYNMVSPVVTATLLTHMFDHPDEAVREAFRESLPVGGVDGTLRNRFRNHRARGNVQAKTGTLSGVSALSGYTRTAANTPVVFVIMANHYSANAGTVRRAQNRVVERLLEFPR